MPELSTTARTLIALKKLEANTPNISTADAARACISDIQLSRAFFDLNNTTDNLSKAKDANAYYTTRAQDTMLAAQFDRTLATLEQTLRNVNVKQEELIEKLKNNWQEIRTINIRILKQFEEAIVKNYDVKSLRESSQIANQRDVERQLRNPILASITDWTKTNAEVQNGIERVYADILYRLPDSDKADSKKFPPPAYTSIRQPGGKSSA